MHINRFDQHPHTPPKGPIPLALAMTIAVIFGSLLAYITLGGRLGFATTMAVVTFVVLSAAAPLWVAQWMFSRNPAPANHQPQMNRRNAASGQVIRRQRKH